MALNSLHITGYRGFAREQIIEFSNPTGAMGSGLTIITGANNSGKSSILECARARNGYQAASFTSGVRNPAQDQVTIQYHFDIGVETLRSVRKGSSETVKENAVADREIFVLPSRRAFDPYFGRAEHGRTDYIQSNSLPSQRMSALQSFSGRLFKINKSPDAFNEVLKKALGFQPNWTIDQTDTGQYFLKFFQGNHSHSSDGMGEGIVSIFSIVDSLHDSSRGDIIFIDEPELSLHPSLQKRVSLLLAEYAKDRQIVVSTHSPYFTSLEYVAEGANLIRVTNDHAEGTSIHQLSIDSKKGLRSLVSGNLYNPHVFGLNARELFFQEDGLILTEGQDDVIFYPIVAQQIGENLPGTFFGWGVGGASNMRLVCQIVKELGFKKVAGILDNDKEADTDGLRRDFADYYFDVIPAKDVRTKAARDATDQVDGLLDGAKKIRADLVAPTRELFGKISAYMEH
ncbi:AAA family ATPase [Brucella ciceri]|uniref:ATP-dependent nuclease n=1 Tax=Brucella ciceri TaxID=391287 RepID=UPI001F13EC98|nr:AAA family ATPase [Brucella ciceri]MCH6205246.1 AAA family ATPase [Brucella ciceri]